MTEDEISVSEQIERTSVNIITFSALNNETGMPLNIPNILGGEDIIEDEVAKLKVEEAFGQLNIQSVFGFESMMFQSCLYDTFHVGQVGEEEGKLTPHIYLLKSNTNNIYLLNLLTTPYADLNLDAYFNEVEFMSRSFSGVFRRTNAQMEKGIIDEEKQFEITRETVDNLSGFMHYQIFTERGLREQVSDMFRKASQMVVGMFFELSVDHSEYQCLGDCGKTFAADDVLFNSEARESCPECGGKLTNAPPILKMDNVRFAAPEGASTFLKELGQVHDSPMNYISYITGIAYPRNIAITTNRLSPTHFSTLAVIPSKAAFASPTDPDEYISLNINWRRHGEKIFMFCSVGNSKFAGRNDVPFIAHITAATINRQIVEGFEKGKSLEAIIQSSVISDWELSDKIKISNINQYPSIKDLPRKSSHPNQSLNDVTMDGDSNPEDKAIREGKNGAGSNSISSVEEPDINKTISTEDGSDITSTSSDGPNEESDTEKSSSPEEAIPNKTPDDLAENTLETNSIKNPPMYSSSQPEMEATKKHSDVSPEDVSPEGGNSE